MNDSSVKRVIETARSEASAGNAPHDTGAKPPRSSRRKLFAALLLILLMPAFLTAGINFYMLVNTKTLIQTAAELSGWNADCILVLGAGVWGENEPSPLLEDRLLSGIEAYETKIAPRILMSGDHGQSDYNEVETMRNYALEKGLPSAAVFMDHAGFSTYESLYRAKEVFGVQKLLIVTQRYHLPRALYLASALGLEARGLAADRRELSGQTKRELREIAARVKDFGFALFKPKTAYTGQPINLNGAVTQCFDRKTLNRLYQAHPTLQPNYPEMQLMLYSYAPPESDLISMLGPPAQHRELAEHHYLAWPLPDDYQIICLTAGGYVCSGVHIIKRNQTAADFSALQLHSSTFDELYKIDPYVNLVKSLDSRGQLCEVLLPGGKALQFLFEAQNEKLILSKIREVDALFSEDLYSLIED